MIIKEVYDDSSLRGILREIDQHKNLMESLAGPFADLRSAGVLDLDKASEIVRDVQQAIGLLKEYEAHFSLPEVGLTARLLAEYKSPLSEAIQQYAHQQNNIREAVEAMKIPWLDTVNQMRSFGGFVEIQNIGLALNKLPAFDQQFAIALRSDLGDWRDPITWPDEIFSNLSYRLSFYENLGFNQALTNFPPKAFKEGLKVAGLRDQPPPLEVHYGPPIPFSDDEGEEEGFMRTMRRITGCRDWKVKFDALLIKK